MVSKLLGSVYTIVLQNVIGDRGMGLFQMAYPIYATLLAVATAGFPVAISKIVAERVALRDGSGARRVLRVAFGLLSAAGVVCFVVLFAGARLWAEVAGDPAAATAIRAIAPALLLVPVLSVLRGYFQGYQRMEPTAVSQVLEQGVRVATILGLAMWLMGHGYGQARAAAGAAFGAVTGAAAGLAMLAWFRVRRHPQVVDDPLERMSTGSLSRRLLWYAFPISLGALVVPLMNNVDVVTVVNLLKSAGNSQIAATTQFGLLSGRAAKLMMLPTTLAAGIGIATMPAVSEAFTLGFRTLLVSRIDTAIRLTVVIAFPAAAGLTLLAGPVDVALFRDSAGSATIQVMAIATVFASLQSTVAACLQGAGWMYLPVFNLLAAGAAKLIGNLWLVPSDGIRGAAEATVFSYAVAAVLNLIALRRVLGVHIDWSRWLMRPLSATFIMSATVFAMNRQWSRWAGMGADRLQVSLAALSITLLGAAVYVIALLVTQSLSERELAAVPKVGPRLVLWCTKWGLLR